MSTSARKSVKKGFIGIGVDNTNSDLNPTEDECRGARLCRSKKSYKPDTVRWTVPVVFCEQLKWLNC